ncbi:RNA 2',3'-cyclic phosphodiesterase [Hasllibacter sp. MH4015]|uniref:RNA 2',3'-cyclic phosphodiesterase n=1 Tax=Hasllibacter sp. MH4015 TaxID=2854029 RepID=UPI001CD55032|nr:RNA 2',3'-cyclic phosphodiesterase [Hasllibacter sp. MH4015]
MRVFIALPIAGDAVTALLRIQSTLPTGKPVPEDNLHLTLAFLGDVPAPMVEVLHDVLSATRLLRPEITFDGLDTFAEMERGLVFAAVRPTDTLSALQAKVAQAARQSGADLPRRKFRPHVTLMRSNAQPKGPARDRLAAAMARPLDVPSFSPYSVELYQSHLSATGARHEVLASYPLS